MKIKKYLNINSHNIVSPRKVAIIITSQQLFIKNFNFLIGYRYIPHGPRGAIG